MPLVFSMVTVAVYSPSAEYECVSVRTYPIAGGVAAVMVGVVSRAVLSPQSMVAESGSTPEAPESVKGRVNMATVGNASRIGLAGGVALIKATIETAAEKAPVPVTVVPPSGV